MYREFYSPRLLNRNAFAYALTHQLAVIPMYAFAVAVTSPADALSERTLWFSLTGLGASFAYEVSRKLDPDAHPALGTYLRLYGRAAAAAAIVGALVLLAVSAYHLDVHRIVWPFVALVLLALPLVFVRPRHFRRVEGAAALLGLVQMLAPTLRYVWRAVA
jgi:4-hydroxybenzoate polyprenyltransferase